MAAIMAEVFARRGDSVLVLHGEDGLDEFTTTAPTRVWVVSGGTVTPVVLDAADLGLPRATAADLRGGEVAVNADVARRVFAGETGPVRDAVLVNAAPGWTGLPRRSTPARPRPASPAGSRWPRRSGPTSTESSEPASSPVVRLAVILAPSHVDIEE
jgi:hypothetical protein